MTTCQQILDDSLAAYEADRAAQSVGLLSLGGGGLRGAFTVRTAEARWPVLW